MDFFSTKSGSILGSFIIAAALVGGAYYFSSISVNRANASSTDDILKAFASKDTDGDGLPDWEESLYGTDPTKSDSLGLGMTDAQAVAQGKVQLKIGKNAPAAAPASSSSLANSIPGVTAASTTLTDQFARAFFNNYISTRGSSPPTPDEATKFVQGAVTNLVQTQVRADAYTVSDIRISGKGAGALQSYAAQAESALGANAVHTQYDNLTYLQDAVQKNDAAAIATLQSISKEYIGSAKSLAALQVPQEAAASHLRVVNALARVGATIGDLSTINTDPLRALVSLGNYQNDELELGYSLSSLNAVFVADGVAIANGTGAQFYGLTSFAASTTPTKP